MFGHAFGQYAAVLGNVFCRIRSWYVFILMYSIEYVTYWARLGAHKCLARPSCDPCHEFHYICSISAKPRSWPKQRVNGVSVPYSHIFRDGWDMADQTEPKRWAESKRASTCVHKHARTHTHTHIYIYRYTHMRTSLAIMFKLPHPLFEARPAPRLATSSPYWWRILTYWNIGSSALDRQC